MANAEKKTNIFFQALNMFKSNSSDKKSNTSNGEKSNTFPIRKSCPNIGKAIQIEYINKTKKAASFFRFIIYSPEFITLISNIKNRTKNIKLTAGIDHKKNGKVLKNKNNAPVQAIILFRFIVNFIF